MVLAYGASEALFSLPPELEEIKRLTRRIVDEQCIPLEQKFLTGDPAAAEGGMGELMVDGSLPPEDYARLRRISEETGLYTMHLPIEHGGGGFGVLGNFVVAEEIQRSIVQLPVAYVPIPLYACSEEQKERYLYPVIRSEKLSAFAQTEPQAGSDPGNSMQTRAVRRGDCWVLNGSKMFISGADEADFLMVLAVTDPEKRQRGGITMFLVDRGAPGVSIAPINVWLTPRRPHQFYVYFDDVEVPDANVLGDVGSGFLLGQQWLAIQDRLTRGSLATGILTRALEMAVDWAKQRITFGQPLAERQAIQWMLVDVFIDLKSIRAISYECAARADASLKVGSAVLPEDVRVLASMAKYVGGNWGHRSIDKIMQIFGGLGETLEMPIPHWYRQLRHGRIGGGTDEIQRMLIARAVLKHGKSLWQA